VEWVRGAGHWAGGQNDCDRIVGSIVARNGEIVLRGMVVLLLRKTFTRFLAPTPAGSRDRVRS